MESFFKNCNPIDFIESHHIWMPLYQNYMWMDSNSNKIQDSDANIIISMIEGAKWDIKEIGMAANYIPEPCMHCNVCASVICHVMFQLSIKYSVHTIELCYECYNEKFCSYSKFWKAGSNNIVIKVENTRYTYFEDCDELGNHYNIIIDNPSNQISNKLICQLKHDIQGTLVRTNVHFDKHLLSEDSLTSCLWCGLPLLKGYYYRWIYDLKFQKNNHSRCLKCHIYGILNKFWYHSHSKIKFIDTIADSIGPDIKIHLMNALINCILPGVQIIK